MSFKLEIAEEPNAAARPMLCGNCKFFRPYVDRDTGRVHPSKHGWCGWTPNIVWSMAYRRAGSGWREQDPIVEAVDVWRDTVAKTCAVYEPK